MDGRKEGESGVVYFEVQHISMKWVWIMMGVIWLSMAAGFFAIVAVVISSGIDQEVGAGALVGSIMCSVVVTLLFTLILPWSISQTRMEVTIDREKIRIFLWPWYRREFEVGKIRSVITRECRPFREFGSRGARRVRGWGVAYLIKGDWGADITMSDGKHLFIGSQKAEELARVLDSIKPTAG